MAEELAEQAEESDKPSLKRFSICPADGGKHELGIFKNCQYFPLEHPEFLHCLSCEAIRCVKCGQIV